MPLGLQAKLLRFLEDKKIPAARERSRTDVDVRVIAATNRLVTELLAKQKETSGKISFIDLRHLN